MELVTCSMGETRGDREYLITEIMRTLYTITKHLIILVASSDPLKASGVFQKMLTFSQTGRQNTTYANSALIYIHEPKEFDCGF